MILRRTNDQHEFKKIKLEKQEYKFVKFNPLNDNQYFVSGETSFKVYDIRTNLEVESIAELKNSIEVMNDSKSYLSIKEEGLTLYTNNTFETLKKWQNFGTITHFNMNSINFNNPEILLVGNLNGDLYYSN